MLMLAVVGVDLGQSAGLVLLPGFQTRRAVMAALDRHGFLPLAPVAVAVAQAPLKGQEGLVAVGMEERTQLLPQPVLQALQIRVVVVAVDMLLLVRMAALEPSLSAS